MDSIGELPCVGFIGAGQMAQAISKGFLESGILKSHQVWASAPTETNLPKFKELGCHVTSKNSDLISTCGIIFLCVKPHIVDTVAKDLQGCAVENNIVLVSVAAGITIHHLERVLPSYIRIIRLMPNTPFLVREGVCAFASAPNVPRKDVASVKKLLGTVGMCEEVEERLIDTICGVSGSGPAFVYTVIEAMSDGAVKMGLPRPLATKFAAQTVLGSAKMVLETGKHPAVLRDAVCSPGGTTIHGVYALEKSGTRAGLMDAVEAATKRARELGRQS